MTEIPKCTVLAFFIVLTFTSPLSFSIIMPSNSNHIHTSAEDQRQIYYNDLVYHGFFANILQTITWEFYSINGSKITVFITDRINYDKVVSNYTPFDSYLLSNNKTSKDEGIFNIPHDGSWYVFFLNQDPSLDYTIVDIKTNLTRNPVFYIIIPITLFITITGLFIIFKILFSWKKIENKLGGLYVYYLGVTIFYLILFLIPVFPFI